MRKVFVEQYCPKTGGKGREKGEEKGKEKEKGEKLKQAVRERYICVAMDDSIACDIYEDILKQTLLFQHIRIVGGDACIERIGKGLLSLWSGLHARVWHPGLDACLIHGNPYGTHKMAHDIIWKDLNECLNNSYNSFLSKQYSKALDCVCYAFDLFVRYIDTFEVEISMSGLLGGATSATG